MWSTTAPGKKARMVIAGTALTSLLASPALLAHAEPAPEPTPSVSAVEAPANPQPAAPPSNTPEPVVPEPVVSATPSVAPESQPSQTAQARVARAAASPTAAIADPQPFYANSTQRLTGTFNTTQPVTVTAQVWFTALNRWSDAAPVRSDSTGAYTVQLSWNNTYPSTQRWRARAVMPDGSTAVTNEVTLTRVAAPSVNPLPILRPNQPAVVTGSFQTPGAVQVWGEVWRSDVNRWSPTKAITSDAQGAFSMQLTWGMESAGTQRWRIAAKTAEGRVDYTNTFNVTRRRQPTVSQPGIIPTGQSTSTWGNFATNTPITVWAEVFRPDVNAWSSAAPVRTNSVGDYSLSLDYDMYTSGTKRWRIAGRYPDGSVDYTNEFSLTRRVKPTVSIPMVIPAGFPMSTFGKFDTTTPLTVWGEVQRNGYWSSTAPVRTTASGDYTLDLNYNRYIPGTLRWRVAARYPDGSIQYTDEFTVRRTNPIDSRCLSGRVLCASKNDLRMWWIVDGEILASFDARFGKPGMETRNGVHNVYWKSRYHWSTLYHVDMPWAMFFNGGQAVHYSAGFASQGHIGAGSAGCINIRDWQTLDWVYNQVRVGDKVVVY